MIEKIVRKFENSDSFVCYMPINTVGFDFVVYECGYEKCDPLHFWGPGKKKYHMFHYIISGKGVLTVNGKSYALKGGEGFHLSPTDVVYYEADEKEPWEYIWVCFGGNLVKGIMDNVAIDSQNPTFKDKDSGEMATLFANLRAASMSENTPNLLSVGNLYILLAYFAKEFPAERGRKQGNGDYFHEMIRFVQSEFTRDITVEEVAEKIGFDRTSVYRIFKKNIGMSPIQYIEGLRIGYACELIKQGKMSLSKVASMVGFNQYEWFLKVFTRMLGVLPGEFLAAYKSDSAVYDKNNRLVKIRDTIETHNATFLSDVRL
jgi:AraC-like DNA-binding protein